MADTSSTTLELPLLEPNGAQSPLPTTTPQPRPKPKSLLRRIGRWPGETWRDLLTDLREVEWAGGIPWIPFYLFMVAVIWQVLMILAIRVHRNSHPADKPGCRPDGSFGQQGDYDPWGISGFFEITLRFGSMSFTEVKVIDIAWDLIVGRLGQSGLAYYSWKAFSSYVRVSMETRPVTFDTYFATHLEEAASIKSTMKMIRDFSARQRLRSRQAMIFIITTMLFILAWPTLASSMTGYAPAEQAFVLNEQQNLVPMDKVNAVAYLIHDGWRPGVNLTGNRLVAYNEKINYNGRPSSRLDYNPAGDDCTRAYSTDPCKLVEHVSEYAERYGFNGLDDNGSVNDIETEWMGTTLAKPSLNISVVYVRVTMGLFGWAEHLGSQGPSNSPNRTFTIADSNTTYSVEDIEAIGSCQILERYQWGFSLLQLLIDVLLLLLWAIGVWILWLKALKELKQRGGIEASSRYRAVLDLASALDQEISKNGETARTLTNKQLTSHVKKGLRGGAFKVDTPAPTVQYRFWKSFWHWAWGHIWWILLFLSTSFMITLSALPATVGASIAAALLIGKTTRTRILIFLVGVIVFSIVTVPLAFLAIFVDLYPGAEDT